MSGTAFTRGSNAQRDLDMTSMVDVTFLLLIFFMVTASFQLQRSIEIPTRQSEVSTRPEILDEKPLVRLEVDQFGGFLVMTPAWELETPGKQNLVAALRQAREESADDLRLSIDVHDSARLSSLVDAMDSAVTAGLADIQVTQLDRL